MRTTVVLVVLCSICVAVNALSIANERSQLQLQSKVKAETPNLSIMQAAFGIVAKTYQDDRKKDRGNNIATILGYYSAEQDKTIPFAWGLNCIGAKGKNAIWAHGERVALDLFKKFCESNAMPVAVCQNLWSNMVVYSTLQPCSKCAVELATFMGKPPKAVYYGATDGADNAGVATVFPAPACKTAADYSCKMTVTATEAASYRDKFDARATKYKDYLKALGENQVAECKAGYLKPSSSVNPQDYPSGFLKGDISLYLALKKKVRTVTVFSGWSSAGGQEAAALVNAVPTDNTCEGFFTAGKKAVTDAVRKPILDKCKEFFDGKGDKKTLYFCKYNKEGKPDKVEVRNDVPSKTKQKLRAQEQGKVECFLKAWHAIGKKEDCAENKLYTSV